ncbi:MAG: protease inhibitor I42 family protein, partial [Candidatus Omnitrophota bacterium]
DEKVVRLVSSEYKAVESKLIGSGGKETWTFKAVGAGKADILFKYVRPWEKDTPPAKKEAFSIVVK